MADRPAADWTVSPECADAMQADHDSAEVTGLGDDCGEVPGAPLPARVVDCVELQESDAYRHEAACISDFGGCAKLHLGWLPLQHTFLTNGASLGHAADRMWTPSSRVPDIAQPFEISPWKAYSVSSVVCPERCMLYLRDVALRCRSTECPAPLIVCTDCVVHCCTCGITARVHGMRPLVGLFPWPTHAWTARTLELCV